MFKVLGVYVFLSDELGRIFGFVSTTQRVKDKSFYLFFKSTYSIYIIHFWVYPTTLNIYFLIIFNKITFEVYFDLLQLPCIMKKKNMVPCLRNRCNWGGVWTGGVTPEFSPTSSHLWFPYMLYGYLISQRNSIHDVKISFPCHHCSFHIWLTCGQILNISPWKCTWFQVNRYRERYTICTDYCLSSCPVILLLLLWLTQARLWLL